MVLEFRVGSFTIERSHAGFDGGLHQFGSFLVLDFPQTEAH